MCLHTVVATITITGADIYTVKSNYSGISSIHCICMLVTLTKVLHVQELYLRSIDMLLLST